MATRADLRSAIRLRGDAVNWGGVADADLNSWIDDAHRELHDLVVLAHPDTYTKQDTDKVIDSNGLISLPADFYKVRGIDWVTNPSSSFGLVALPRYSFAERNRVGTFAYHDLGGSVKFVPTYYATGKTVRLYYVPTRVALVDDVTTLDLVLDNYREYIVLECAAKVWEIQELPEQAAPLRARKAELENKLRAMIPRDVGTGEQIPDVTRGRRFRGDPSYWLP